jgi:ferredoxin
MAVLEENQLLGFLEGQSQKAWLEALDELGPSMHPVDRDATRIWFAFWPLEMNGALESSDDADAMARAMDLEGNWRLEDQIDSAVAFLYGAHYWAPVKRAVSEHGEASTSLAETIRSIAGRVAANEKLDVALVLGITAVALMTLREVGRQAFDKVVDTPAEGELLPKNPERVIARRKRESGDGLFTFLKGINRRWDVRWNERTKNGTFRAITGQDIAMAGDAVEQEYRSLDYRRTAGPVPVECRVGSCGYCWIGLLEGREKLSEISDFERERLAYFGYDTINDKHDKHPLIRLACQSQCHGDVTLAIAPWNGELERRHQKGRERLGTA